jgi:hypothetical protein
MSRTKDFRIFGLAHKDVLDRSKNEDLLEKGSQNEFVFDSGGRWRGDVRQMSRTAGLALELEDQRPDSLLPACGWTQRALPPSSFTGRGWTIVVVVVRNVFKIFRAESVLSSIS